MRAAHELILAGGALGLVSILLGLASRRIGAPVLLVFLVIGMLAGEDGPGGIPFDDFRASYLIGSIALAVILFEGGMSTERAALQRAFWPALALATLGVGVTAGLTGLAGHLIVGASWTDSLLVGAAMAPTDAAAVASLLRQARVAVPDRVQAVLEVESGLNDPMSVFLMLLLVQHAQQPGAVTTTGAAVLFLREMGGGAAFGLAGGFGLVAALRAMRLDQALIPVFALAAALALFGLAQALETSGFLAVFVAGAVLGQRGQPAREATHGFFGALGWLAQIVLFLMLGLLVTPHGLVPLVLPALGVAAALILVARPAATALCLLPFGFRLREVGFAAWVGLRGAVPIYLAVIPVLAGLSRGPELFGAAFVLVIVSLTVQGWTIAPVARLLGYGTAPGGQTRP